MKFELDADEKKRFDVWYKTHIETEHGGETPYSGAIGGGHSFTITPTGIGDFLGVECNHCKRKLVADKVVAALHHDSELAKRYHETLTDFSDF